MKKSQRARLAALTALATRSEAEAAEFANLTALAAQHPDASQDTDDASSRSEGCATGPGLAAASNGAPNTGPAAAGNGASFVSTMQAALQTLRSKNSVAAELVAARSACATLTTERDTARIAIVGLTTERDTAVASLALANAACETFAAYFGLDAKSLAGKSAAEVSALLNAKISAQVTEQVSTLGFDPGKLPGSTHGASADTLSDIQGQLASCKDPVQAGILAQKANALRDQVSAASAARN